MLDPAMQDSAAPSHDEPVAFTLQEAATILGVSLNTLRRRIDAGQVRAEKVERPQGHVWRVYLDTVQGSVQHPSQHAEQRSEQHADGTVQQDAASTLQQPAALMQAEAMAAYTRSILEPLVEALERSEGRTRELTAENAELRAMVATREATISSLTARTAAQTTEVATERVGALRAFVTRWWWVGAAAVLLVAVLVWALVPR